MRTRTIIFYKIIQTACENALLLQLTKTKLREKNKCTELKKKRKIKKKREERKEELDTLFTKKKYQKQTISNTLTH